MRCNSKRFGLAAADSTVVLFITQISLGLHPALLFRHILMLGSRGKRRKKGKDG